MLEKVEVNDANDWFGGFEHVRSHNVIGVLNVNQHLQFVLFLQIREESVMNLLLKLFPRCIYNDSYVINIQWIRNAVKRLTTQDATG